MTPRTLIEWSAWDGQLTLICLELLWPDSTEALQGHTFVLPMSEEQQHSGSLQSLALSCTNKDTIMRKISDVEVEICYALLTLYDSLCTRWGNVDLVLLCQADNWSLQYTSNQKAHLAPYRDKIVKLAQAISCNSCYQPKVHAANHQVQQRWPYNNRGRFASQSAFTLMKKVCQGTVHFRLLSMNNRCFTLGIRPTCH